MQNHSNQVEYVYAGFWIRFAAHAIDAAIVAIVLGIINSSLGSLMILFEDTPLGGAILFQYTMIDILDYILTVTYFVLMTYFQGATLGKKILNLKVVSVKENRKLKLFDVIYRETIGRYFSDLFLGIGYLTVAFTAEKEAIHDMLCGTRVIGVKKEHLVYPGIANLDERMAEHNDECASEMKTEFVPHMMEEPSKEGGFGIQDDITKQWNQILNKNNSVTTPQEEEQNIEEDS